MSLNHSETIPTTHWSVEKTGHGAKKVLNVCSKRRAWSSDFGEMTCWSDFEGVLLGGKEREKQGRPSKES